MSDISFRSIQDTKKILERLKKCCSLIAKYNLNSHCELQFIQDFVGVFHPIISHNPKNGERFDIYHTFDILTKDEFKIDPEDVKYFDFGDERTGVPIVTSSFDLSILDDTEHFQRYGYSQNTFYIFPKFVLEAIKANIITDVEVQNLSNDKYNHSTFKINFIYEDSGRFRSKLFIQSTLENSQIFNMRILPLEMYTNLPLSCIKNDFKKEVSSYLEISEKEWEEITSNQEDELTIKLIGPNKHEFMIYSDDFIFGKFERMEVYKIYEDNNNVVSLRIRITDKKGFNTYFKYRYYETL